MTGVHLWVQQDLDSGVSRSAADDEIGPPVLEDVCAPRDDAPLPMLARELQFALALEQLATPLLPEVLQSPIDSNALRHQRCAGLLTSLLLVVRVSRLTTVFCRLRLRYLSTAARALIPADLIDPPAPLLPSSSLFTLYLPFLRLMTFADDMHATAADGALAALGTDEAGARVQRRSTRLGGEGRRYVRWVQWVGKGARLVREGGFAGL